MYSDRDCVCLLFKSGFMYKNICRTPFVSYPWVYLWGFLGSNQFEMNISSLSQPRAAMGMKYQ